MKHLLGILLCVTHSGAVQAVADDGRMVPVKLQMRHGGFIEGRVAEFDDGGSVLAVDADFVAVNWDDVKLQSAYRCIKRILISRCGSEADLRAEDHFRLGLFAGKRGNHRLGVAEFNQAERLDRNYRSRIDQAWTTIRSAQSDVERFRAPDRPGAQLLEDSADHPMRYLRASAEENRRAIELDKALGEKVREEIAPGLVLLETPHFLIWTDWPERHRELLPHWAELLYERLCLEFGFASDEPIWRGKCPIYCFRSKKRFDKFARTVDQYDSVVALGYTKTAQNGYARVVLRRLGSEVADLDRFATTLVHETSHAFMHAYGSARPLPPWLSEGLADFVAERVLSGGCRTGENAAAVARQYVYHHKSVQSIFQADAELPAHYYPVSHSMVDFLIQLDRRAFVSFVGGIKSGVAPGQALADHYGGMTTLSLEREWRQHILHLYPPQ